MNFYLDFEATQFTHKVISIGCIASNGKTFYSLVNAEDEQIGDYITKLTGLTDEMIQNAPSADSVFSSFRNFIHQESQGEETFFFVYGHDDCHYLENTAGSIKNEEIKQFIYNLGDSLIDYSKFVYKFFHTYQVSLKNVVEYFRGEPIVQNHNALEDAEMLLEIVIAIANAERPAVSPWKKEPKLSASERFNKETKNISILMTDKNGKQQIFNSRKSARNYIYNNLYKITKTDKTKSTINRKLNRCLKGIDKTYFERTWSFISEGE